MTILVIHIILEIILFVKIAKDYHEIKKLKNRNEYLRDNMRNDLVNKLNSHRYKLPPKYTEGEKQVAEQFNALLDRVIEDIK